MHLRAKFDIQIPVQLGIESAVVPKALGWTGITPTTSKADTQVIHWGMQGGMRVAFWCLCCGRTPANLPRSSTAPNHPASSDFVVELYVGVDPCLAAECWLHATSVTSCKGWEMSALEKGPERTKVTGTFVQACVKTPHRGREGLCYHPAYLPSCAIRPLCQKTGIGAFAGSQWLPTATVVWSGTIAHAALRAPANGIKSSRKLFLEQ